MYFMASMVPEDEGRRIARKLVKGGYTDLTGCQNVLVRMKEPKTFRILQPSRSVSGYLSIETQDPQVAASVVNYLNY